VTPLLETPEEAVQSLVAFWKQLGMNPVTTSPETHDEIVANISHLPHILATSLCTYLAGRDSQWRHYAGSGLADTSRIAAGSPSLWKTILEQNRDEILRALEGFENEIHSFRSALANEQYFEIQNRLERGKVYRDSLRPSQNL